MKKVLFMLIISTLMVSKVIVSAQANPQSGSTPVDPAIANFDKVHAGLKEKIHGGEEGGKTGEDKKSPSLAEASATPSTSAPSASAAPTASVNTENAKKLEELNREVTALEKKQQEDAVSDLHDPNAHSTPRIHFNDEGREPIVSNEGEPFQFDREAHSRWVLSKESETKKIVGAYIARYGHIIPDLTIYQLIAHGRIKHNGKGHYCGLPGMPKELCLPDAELIAWQKKNGIHAHPRDGWSSYSTVAR